VVVVQLVWFLCFLGAWLFCTSVALAIVLPVDVSERAWRNDRSQRLQPDGNNRADQLPPRILDPPRVHRAPLAHGCVVLHRGLRACSAASVVGLGRCDPEFGKNAGKISA
jgi:hypothetical protein